MIVLLHNGENAGVTWRDTGAHVRHHSRHKDVTGAFPVGKERPCHFSATPTTASCVAAKPEPSLA
jgi:hypothetical protein